VVPHAMTNDPNLNDPHGYGYLNDALIKLEGQLLSFGELTGASALRRAELFYGAGSPTEFLGRPGWPCSH
jgi:hypothetical protein